MAQEHIKDHEWIMYVSDKLTTYAVRSKPWWDRAGDINNIIVRGNDRGDNTA